MSFEPFKFTYVPPATVASPVSTSTTETAPAAAIDGSSSKAGHIVGAISDLLDASNYLQSVIASRYSNTGIQFDPAEDPELARALTRKFGADNQVNTVTIPMYSNLLDTEATAHQLEIALGPNSALTPNPIEVSDTSYITQQIDKILTGSGEYKNQIPTLLRGLKSDSLFLANLQESFQQYPVLRTPSNTQDPTAQAATLDPAQSLISAQGLDVSPELGDYMDGMLGRMNSVYASTYSLLLSPNHIESDLLSVANVFSGQSTADVSRFVSLLTALKSVSHQEALSLLSGGMATFVYARLGAEMGKLATGLDRLTSMVVSPLKNVTGEFGRLLGLSNNISSSVGRVPAGGMAGSSLGNPCLKDMPHNSFINTKQVNLLSKASQLNSAFNALPDSLAAVAEHLSWGLHQVSNRSQFTKQAFMQLSERRLNDRGEQLNLLCSMSSIDTLINLGKGFVNQTQKGSSSKTTPATPAQAVGGILSNLTTSTGTSFTITDGQVLVNPPDMPTPPDSVSRVLNKGGVNQQSARSLQQIL